MRKALGVLCILTGAALLGIALWQVASFYRDAAHANAAAQAVTTSLREQIASRSLSPSDAQKSDAQKNDAQEMPVMQLDGQSYIGYLEIPTVALELPVLHDWSYANLKNAPCLYAGTSFDEPIVILAHNYAQHFGTLGLLEAGDPVQMVDARGVIHRYEVAKIEVLGAFEVQEMLDPAYDLTLFTCTRGGRSRLTVRLTRVLSFGKSA